MVDITGWPTDTGGGSVSTEARWRAMARLWAPSGVADGYLGSMAPSYAGGNVTVQAGGAWVDGHYCEQLSSSSVVVAATGLVVVRFTPADNRFQIVWVASATVPTQTTATWELPIAQMTGGAMTDVRVFVSTGSVTTASIKDSAVTATKMAGNAVTAFIEMGGDVTSSATALTGTFQPVLSHTFTKPASWTTYMVVVWGGAAFETTDDQTVQLRAAVGANNGEEREDIAVAGGFYEFGVRTQFGDLSGASQIIKVDARKTLGPCTVHSAWVQFFAMRST